MIELNWEMTWFEQAEQDWWDANPTASDADFEKEIFLQGLDI